MSLAYNRQDRGRQDRGGQDRGRWRLGREGVTSLEFGMVALIFLMVLIGCMDLGRYYLVEHSLRTIVAEAARAALVDASINGTIDPTTAGFAAITPFVDNANLTLQVIQPSGFPGVNQITVTATYSFAAYSPIWRSLNGVISESTVLWY
jgi:Flp pilus assembly protein TadG